MKILSDKPSIFAAALSLPLFYFVAALLFQLAGFGFFVDLVASTGQGDTLFFAGNVSFILGMLVSFSNIFYMNISSLHKNNPDTSGKTLLNLAIIGINMAGLVFLYGYLFATFPQIPVGQG